MSDPGDITSALTGPHLPAHFYVHVPFCRMKCSYCDFYSVTDLAEDTIGAILRGIEGQIAQWGGAALPGVVETLYVGGGTPTVVAGGLVRIIDALRANLPLRAGAEITIEANPDSLTAGMAEALAAAGVTRISVGVQSFADAELGLLGRVHTVEEARAACGHVTRAGLELSLDLMCGIPGQDVTSWTTSLDRAVRTGASHISVYPLTLEPGTPLEVAVDSGLVAVPDADLAADMMLLAEEFLGNEGMVRYEVSNYARSGRESRHNTAYWTGAQYAGIGPAAHGMLDAVTAVGMGLLQPDEAEDVARVRYSNPATLETYLFGAAEHEVELLTAREAAREDVMLGLRLTRGVPLAQAEAAGVDAALRELETAGLVERATEGGVERWRTTRRGWLLGNEVFGRVWAGE